ncbi:Hypothetical protein, putative [Bodo saltans]|uniref:Uncharacterized protein n=1 Tax=Bodo saltans TaxID=75058 RepID=A0A0S4JLG9_BODSA|nr:Hypothetical protein, putative [Bodo saltans]|eukprot:CUG90991.1 Hypothetical protein, putative [Bodo saltans]
MSGNKLDSLRFLFQLRADFKERLLFLWLQENPITRKPEYREQVRATLPRLVCLDGESIRRAPLQLPHPRAPSLARNIDPQEYAEVLAVVDRFLYAWESQQVPLPPIAFKPSDRKLPFHPALTEEARQLRKRLRNGVSELEQSTNEEDALFTRASSFAINAKPKKKKSANVDSNEDDSDDDDGHDGDLEEDLDENVFAKRYMHPECTFSLSTAPGCGWFDADSTSCVTELDTHLVEVARTRGVNDANNSNNGTTSSSSSKKKLLVLSKQDMNELRVMDVSIRNHHRNLILGKPALYLMVKGPVNCFTAYRSTLYPERMIVDHHLDACVPQVTLVGDEDMSGLAAKEKEAMGDREPVKGPAPSKKKIARDPYAARELPAALRARAAKAAAEGPAPAPALQISQLFLGSATLSSSTPARKPLAFLVTIHGKMSWRSPTMSADHSITLCYDRTIGLVHRPVPTKGSLPSKSLHKVPRFVVASDMIFLRPAADVASSRSNNNDVLFEARAEDRLDGVAVEFGLDGTSDNKAFARSVAERATSDAALHHVLTALLDVKTKQTNKDDDNGEGQIGLSNEELVIQQKKSEFCGELQQKELKRSESSRQLDGTNDPVLMQTRAASTTSNFLPIRTAFTVRPSFSAFDIIEFADATATDEASRKNNESGDDDLLSADKEIKIELAQVDAALAEANAFHTTSFKW